MSDRAVPRARIRCTADSKYRLWVNGEPVGTGPARGHPEHPYYDTHTVPLRRGRNTVAFLVEHYNLDRTGLFPAIEGGLWCRIESGGHVLAATDRTWKGLMSRAHSGYEGALFPERFDARLEPEGWERPDFDDADWPAAVQRRRTRLAPPEQFLPRPIPPLTEKRLTPVRVLGAGRCRDDAITTWEDDSDLSAGLWRMEREPARANQWTPDLPAPCPWPTGPVTVRLKPGEAAFLALDFGFETLAAQEIHAEGPAGVIIDLGHSECLWDNRVATQWQMPRLKQTERIILRQGTTRHRLMQPRGFRYVLLRIANPTRRRCKVILNDVAAFEMVYPATARGAFRCSDDVLNRIFDLSARTVNLCMEDAWTDCPWRERAQWVGDMQPEALFAYYCFGAYDLARKAVREITSGVTDEGWVPGVFPIAVPYNLPTWGMRVPVIVWDYFLHTGDEETLNLAWEGVTKQMAWFARYADRSGLLRDLPGWCFLDWTATDARHADGALQGWYLEALECSARLARAVGDQPAVKKFERKAGTLRKTLARLYWSPAKRAFRKYRPNSPHALPRTDPELLGQHENFLFTLLGVGTPAQRRQALDAMRGPSGRYLPNLGDYQSAHLPETRGNYVGEEVLRVGSPFWSFYALLSLMEAGRAEAALEVIRVCWGLMLDFGATSCWEMWDRHTSLCHGWSAAPAMILPAYILGVRPLAPGFRRFKIRPRCCDLEWARGRVPTPSGAIRVAWRREEDAWRCDLTAPPETSGRFKWDTRANGPVRTMELDGERVAPNRSFAIRPGKHTITARR